MYDITKFDSGWIVVRKLDNHIAPQAYPTKKAALQAIKSGEADLTAFEFEVSRQIKRVKTAIMLGDDIKPIWDSAVITRNAALLEALNRLTNK